MLIFPKTQLIISDSEMQSPLRWHWTNAMRLHNYILLFCAETRVGFTKLQFQFQFNDCLIDTAVDPSIVDFT